MSTPAPLKSRVWSCSELAKGAALCAEMSGMDLCYDLDNMSREQMIAAIQDFIHICMTHISSMPLDYVIVCSAGSKRDHGSC